MIKSFIDRCIGYLLASGQSWYRLVMDRLPVGVITVDTQCRVTYMNPQACEITGWDRSRARSRFCRDILRGGQCDAACPLEIVLSQVQQTVDMRSTLTNREGRTIPIRFRSVPLFDEDQNLRGAVEVFFDISHIVALEEERQRTLSFFAHDMKSPLVGAMGFMQRLLEGKAGELTSKQTEYLKVVSGELHHVQELVNDYLDVLRLDSQEVGLNLDLLDIGQFLEEIMGGYQTRARDKGLGLCLELADTLPLVMADRIRLRRALGNLVDNAVKFSSQGEVKLTCSAIGGDKIRILVCDSGPGLSEDDQVKLFTSFFRGSAGKTVEGTGLGLAAAKAIIEAHGGEIFASNRQHGGACFSVVLSAAGQAEQGQ